MKKRFTFSKMLYNDKMMMLLSLLVAIFIWYNVLVGPANIAERVITAKVTVTLDNYAEMKGLRVIGDNEFDVQVTVQGRWSVISRLTSEDLIATASVSAMSEPGDVTLPLTIDKNSGEWNYEILNHQPNTVTVRCDYWQEGAEFKVESDVSVLRVSDPETSQIGEPVIDRTTFPSGSVTIDGPKSTVAQIKNVVARVTTEETLSENKQYDVPLVALDAQGKPVDLEYCTIREVPSGVVKVTVPVWQDRRINLGFEVINVPAGINADTVLSIEPAVIEVLGPASELDALEEQFKKLGTIDFRTLSVTSSTVKFPLNIPSTVRAVETPEQAVVTLDTTMMAQKAISLEASQKNVIVNGLSASQTAVVTPHEFSEVMLVGNASAVNAISEAAITFEISVGNTPERKAWYSPVIKVNGRDDVWVYVGDAATEKIYVEIR